MGFADDGHERYVLHHPMVSATPEDPEDSVYAFSVLELSSWPAFLHLSGPCIHLVLGHTFRSEAVSSFDHMLCL